MEREEGIDGERRGGKGGKFVIVFFEFRKALQILYNKLHTTQFCRIYDNIL